MPADRSRSISRARGFFLLFLGFSLVLTAGCGGKGEVPLVPVSGTVKIHGVPMPMGTVEFHPDAGKGNNFSGKPKGMIKSDGTYTLNTDGRDGAPVGWYKVTVSGQGMPDPSKMTEGGKPPTPLNVQAKYGKPETSGFSFEVKDGAPAGTYDLSLSK
jgi:hypothetical protein